MLNLDIDVIVELYWGTNPAWDGNEIAKFFHCGYQSIYNHMEKYGVRRRNKSEAEINYYKGLGVKKQLISKCPNCNVILNFSKCINPFKYSFQCPVCDKSYYLNMKGRLTKPEDIERFKEFKKIAHGMKIVYGEIDDN